MNQAHPQSSFVDTKGAVWQLRLVFSDRKLLIEAAAFDPFKVFEDDFAALAALNSDPERFIRALYVLLEKQLEAQQVSPEEFASRIDGTVFEDAGVAFARAVVDFFGEPRRSLGHALLDKGIEAVPLLGKKIGTAIAQVRVASPPDESSDSAGNAPTSSDAPPGPSASENSSPDQPT